MVTKIKFPLFIFVFLFSFSLFSQVSITIPSADSAKEKKVPIVVTGYVDAYYASYTDSVGINAYQKFPSVSPRSNQFGLNAVCLNFSYDAEKVRAFAGVHFGDIQRSTWNGNVMEAHAGVRIAKKLWLDAGYFRTHFGTESLLPRENLTSSVSVPTFYEPYYEAGFRLNFNPSEKLMINLYLINGYGIYADNNDKKSFGALITYAINDKCNIGYSNYAGDDSPKGDSLTHWRMMHNLYFNYVGKKLKIQIGGDYGTQQHSQITDKKKTATMFSGLATIKYEIATKISMYGRGEMFHDADGFMSGVIIDSKSMYTGYKLWGATIGAEYKPTENSYVRLEGRKLTMNKDQTIFRWNGENTYSRFEVLFNIGVYF